MLFSFNSATECSSIVSLDGPFPVEEFEFVADKEHEKEDEDEKS